MSELYHLSVGDEKTKLDLSVFFTSTYINLNEGSQSITICGLRIGKGVNTYWGTTIKNPQDIINPSKAHQWAFRRAFLQFAKDKGALVKDDHLDLKGCKSGAIYNKTKAAQDIFDILRKQLHDAGAW